MSMEKNKNRIALIDEFGVQISYDNMREFSNLFAEQAGERCLIFILASNTIGSVLGYAACISHHYVPVMVNEHIDVEMLWGLLNSYNPRYVWLPDEWSDLADDWCIIYRAYGYSLVKTPYQCEYELHEDLALLLTTSGSTGSPKFVRQSYDNIRSNTTSIIEYLKLDENERAITTLPMNYTYGLSIINTHLTVGATILLTDKPLMQKDFWQFLREQKATSFGGVPYTYEMLAKLRFFKMDLPYLKTMTQAGGKLTPELHEKFAEYAAATEKKFIVMYGQCEATARMGYLPPEKAVEKKGSMGIAIPGGKFRLIDNDCKEIKTPHTTGELVYEGANVTMGYAESASDLIKGDERHGVLETGDMAEFDEEGFYYIVGRKKRFLKIYGNRVNLDEMDRLIKGKYEIEVTCAGVDDHMYIFITDASLAAEIKEYVSKTTKLNPVAFKVMVIDEIPKSDSGKIRYSELERYYDI